MTSISDHNDYSNEIVALDLDTGKPRWSKSFGTDVIGVPLAATGEGVLAVKSGCSASSPRAIRLSWKDGTVTRASKPYPTPGLRVANCVLHRGGDAVYGVSLSVSASGDSPSLFALK
ncbi:outer membrane protein assembly factor BamB [Saccharopolyspora lacisalsi]|uniref:Outer membrane protein assembly factor BamB n=1 Tax=Halosaccharopolyspora lacisalsi TaxID=1000566 RepID=A0A839E9N8_9PSEU|nr:PQQ-binding-like beta-propeller repeat protein [Halosaccharopolyspora lacisalsi]MBA8827558.1 outer membrane protein assembly factor BamB [Halosaccharopolyspora lacisalsi]